MAKKIGPRQYIPSHVRRLDTLSGNQCAAPECERSLVARDGQSIVSKICHIEAASPLGPRYNPKMSDEERRHYNNLILMCDECHNIIDNKDNVHLYPTPLLQEWKRLHEEKNQMRLMSKRSMLSKAIDAISNLDLEEEAEESVDKTNVFKIDDKIKHNQIKRNKHLIDDYKIFYTKISSLYSELEAAGSFKKTSLLRNVNRLYLKSKGKYVVTEGKYLEELQKHSDDILDDVENELISKCSSESDLDDDEISFGVSIIMVDAFMRCKILENPLS
ncbi:TPA: hypothetical protein KD105_003935 [Vibrio parahaemolyticus]|nr:hypothetical protein [Vibrio parahaemolyticus]